MFSHFGINSRKRIIQEINVRIAIERSSHIHPCLLTLDKKQRSIWILFQTKLSTPDNITPWSPTIVFTPCGNWVKSYFENISYVKLTSVPTISSAVARITCWNNWGSYSLPKRMFALIVEGKIPDVNNNHPIYLSYVKLLTCFLWCVCKWSVHLNCTIKKGDFTQECL